MSEKESSTYQYQNYVICYLDILGFKNLVSSTEDSEGEFLKKYFISFDEFQSKLSSDSAADSIEIQLMSDTIVITCPIPEGATPYKLDEIFHKVAVIGAIYQATNMESNIWLRGAITIGKIYQDKHRIVGPGLIRSYSLESKYAKYPRIILDSKVISKYYNNFLQFNERMSKHESFEIAGNIFSKKEDFANTDHFHYFDDLHFIDYVGVFIKSLEKESLRRIRRVTEQVQKNILDDPNIAEKHWWVMKYIKCKFNRQKYNKDNNKVDVEQIEKYLQRLERQGY